MRLQLCWLASLTLLGTACSGLRVSRYYWGADLHDDGEALVRPVPERVDGDLQPFSRSCMEAILRGDMTQLRAVAAGDLPEELGDPSVPDRLQSTSAKYELTGKFEQIDSTGGGVWMDEVMSRDPYKTYGFFVTEFLLPGKTNAHAFVLVQRKEAKLALLGFDIHPTEHGGAGPDVKLMPKALKGWRSLGRPR
jgi:hypothetical protein